MKTRTTLVGVLLITLFIAGCEKELTTKGPGNLVPNTVMEDASLPSITVNGTTLHAEAFGNPDSPMVVMLHGGPGGDYRAMLKLKKLADDGYYAVFYDQRGTGLSQRHEKNNFSLQQMLDDLTAVISHYRTRPGQKVFLLGQSWGAMLATAYVNAYPTAINGIILSEPGGFTWNQVENYVQRTQELSLFSESANDIFYPDQFITGGKNDHEALDYKLAISSAFDTREGNALGNAGVYPFWRFGAVSNQAMFGIAKRDGFDWTTHLAQYQKQVLFCYSELNKAYGTSYAQSLAAEFPDVQLEKINGSGHEIPWFGFNQFYLLVKNYLNSH